MANATTEGTLIRGRLLALVNVGELDSRTAEAIMVDLAALESRLAAATEQAKLASVVLNPAAPPAPRLIPQPMGQTDFAVHDHLSHHGKPMPTEQPGDVKIRTEAAKWDYKDGKWKGGG